MLRLEQSGQAFNKSVHRQALMEQIGRSEAAIEYKRANISAVLAELGFPYIAGYQPRRHYQQKLFEAVAERIREDRGLYALLAAETVAPDRESSEVMQDGYSELPIDSPPPRRPAREIDVPEHVRWIVGKFEPPAERDARNRELGKAGEALVFHVEKRRLQDIGQTALSRSVRWIARDDGDGYGYDILSFQGTGDHPDQKRWLEIKTTNGPKETPFYVTTNELRVSRNHPDTYRIVRLYDFRRQARAYCLAPPLEHHVRLAPTIFRASP